MADFHWTEFLTFDLCETPGWRREPTALHIHIWATFNLNSGDVEERACFAAALVFLPPSPPSLATKGGVGFGVISAAGFKEPPSSESMQRLV